MPESDQPEHPHSQSRPRRALAAICLTLSCLTGLSIPAGATSGRDSVTPERVPPVVWIALDELPLGSLLTAEGRIDKKLYPGFAKLADLATWYPQARTLAPSTGAAMPSLLTGQLPGPGPELPAGPTLAEYLAPSVPFTGERPWCSTNACQPAYQAAGKARCPQAEWCVETQRSWGWYRLLATITPTTAGRGVWYEHIVMPHAPWNILDNGQEYLPRNAARGFQTDSALQFATDAQGQRIFTQSYWTGQSAHVAVLNQAHLIQLAYVDRMISHTLDTVVSGGHLDETLLIVTADHGMAFTPNESGRAIRRAPRSLAQVLSVPLFIKYPHQARGIIDRREASIIDVLPTVLDVAGIRPLARLDGRSLRAAPGPGRAIPLIGFQVPGGTVPVGPANLEVLTAWREGFTRLDSVKDLYRPGIHGQLLGRQISRLERGASTGLTATLESPIPAQFVTTNLAPVLAYGEIPGARRGDTVVVVEDGVVAGVGTIWMDTVTPRFQIILDRRLVKKSSTRVQLHLIRRNTMVLEPLDLGGGQDVLPIR